MRFFQTDNINETISPLKRMQGGMQYFFGFGKIEMQVKQVIETLLTHTKKMDNYNFLYIICPIN